MKARSRVIALYEVKIVIVVVSKLNGSAVRMSKNVLKRSDHHSLIFAVLVDLVLKSSWA